jgi:hypothetical protein
VTSLRVVDASVSGYRRRQYQCLIVMVAEKAVDLIRPTSPRDSGHLRLNGRTKGGGNGVENIRHWRIGDVEGRASSRMPRGHISMLLPDATAVRAG